MTSIEDLSHDDQVALWAGRVVRKEAEIESMLRTIFYYLCGQGLSWVIVPSGFATVLQGIREMLKKADLDAGFKADCFEALNRLNLAHRQRNRIVHDQWVLQDAGTFVSATKGVSDGTNPEIIWDVSEFENCYVELRFCFVMISGLYWSIPELLDPRSSTSSELLDANREALAGRVQITDERSWTYTDPGFIARNQVAMEARSARFRAEHPDWFPDE